MWMEWLGNCSDWLTLQLGQFEEILSASVTGAATELTSDGHDAATTLGPFWSTLLKVASWSPIEAFTATKVQLEERLWDIHQFSSEVCLTAVNLALSVCQQVSVGNFSNAFSLVQQQSGRVVEWFEFSEFQHKVIREFSLILIGDLVLLWLAWRVYGQRISARFFASHQQRPKQPQPQEQLVGGGLSAADGGGGGDIDDLKVSMSELQLPNDYDFKYK